MTISPKSKFSIETSINQIKNDKTIKREFLLNNVITLTEMGY